MDKLEKLLSQVRVYVNEDKQRRAEAFRRGECYNVFNVLGVDNMELSHSAFLAALLNPDGSHGMQDAFLKAFIDTIAHGGTKPELDTAHAKVYTEYNIGNITETTGGRIDILITDRSDTGSGKAGGHAIIIENKIWAADQPNQLVRYNNFAHEMYAKYALLYLTLNGEGPSDQSKGELTDYRCISYRSDIIGWLRQCARLSFDKPLVRETINQYIDLIQQLTNQNTMEQEQLIRLLTNKENFEQATAVEQSMPDVRKHIFQDIFRKQVEEQLKKEDAPKVTIAECASDGYSSYTISFRIEGWMQENLLKFTTERGRMYYGIPRTMEINGICEKEIADGFYSNPWWIVWKWMPKDYQNWSKDSEIFMHILSADKGSDTNADTETLASIMVQCIKETLRFIAKNNIELK